MSALKQCRFSGPAAVFSIMCIFSRVKYGLQAARNKFTDAADLLFLEGRYRDMLRSDVNILNLRDVGMALRRYSHLNAAFQRIGVDIQAALQAANASIKLSENRAPFDIQQGVLG